MEKGIKQVMAGWKLSDETRAKISAAKMGNKSRTGMRNSEEQIRAIREFHLGRKRSKEAKQNIKTAIREYWDKQNPKLEEHGGYRYNEWRSAVLARDNYTCVRCKATNNLVAHHIKEWDTFPELRYEVSNGETLCRSCHKKEHDARKSEESRLQSSS